MNGPTFPPEGNPHDPRSPNHGQHDPGELGALALGLLDPARTRAVEEYLATCPACRRDLEDLTAVTDLLGDVPPEALLEGPPDSDLVLARTLRQIRTEAAAERRRRIGARLAAAAAAIAVLPAPASPSAGSRHRSPVVVAAPSGPVPGGDAAGDGVPGVTLTAVVSPAAGWVRVSRTSRASRPVSAARWSS